MARIAFRPFAPSDLAGLRLAAAGALQEIMATPGYGEALVVPGLSWSGVVDGQVVGAAGVLPQWRGRAAAWALIGGALPRRAWPAITAQALTILDAAHAAGFRRIEASVLRGFGPAERWAARLGFRAEGLMHAYAPDGADHWLFARVACGA